MGAGGNGAVCKGCGGKGGDVQRGVGQWGMACKDGSHWGDEMQRWVSSKKVRHEIKGGTKSGHGK